RPRRRTLTPRRTTKATRRIDASAQCHRSNHTKCDRRQRSPLLKEKLALAAAPVDLGRFRRSDSTFSKSGKICRARLYRARTGRRIQDSLRRVARNVFAHTRRSAASAERANASGIADWRSREDARAETP